MEIIDLFILINIIFLIIVLNNSKPIQKPIKLDNQNNNNNLKNILNTNNDLDKININRGSITRDTIIKEDGGSSHYKDYTVNSNISNNSINYDNKYLSYIKLPYNHKK